MLEHPPHFNITQSELAPRVADYFDNLLAQRDAILERYGLTPETAEKFCDLQSTDEDREAILALYEKMVYVIEDKQIPPGEKMFIYIVPDALNPYADAYKQAGLSDDHPLCPEKKEMTLDIPEIIAFQTKHYREQKMDAWADDIEQHIDQLYDQLSTPEEQHRIELRIKAGCIPIVMPSGKVQREDWVEALQQLKPAYYHEGTPIDINESNLYLDGLRKKMTDPAIDASHSFFRDIPDRPYLIWTKPIAECNTEMDSVWRTTNLTVKEQAKLLETLHEHHPALCDEQDMTPLEYAALQSLHTEIIRHSMDDFNMNMENITPLDAEGFTRFIRGGSLSDGSVLDAFFRPVKSRLSFGGDGADASARRGFRPAARS